MNYLKFKKILASVFAALFCIILGLNFNKVNIKKSTRISVAEISANQNKIIVKSEKLNFYESLAVIKNTPLQDAIILFNQVAFSFYRSVNIDAKFCDFEKDKSITYNLNRFYIVNRLVYNDDEVLFNFKNQNKSLCPIRPRISHGPPFHHLV
jgi:hypothetical protein